MLKKQKREMVHVYLTQEEKGKIESSAKKIGISTSSYIKVKLFSEKLVIILLITFLFSGLIFSERAEAATNYNLHGYNGSDWVPILTDANGTIRFDANVSSVSWNNVLDIPSGFS